MFHPSVTIERNHRVGGEPAVIIGKCEIQIYATVSCPNSVTVLAFGILSLLIANMKFCKYLDTWLPYVHSS